MRHLSSAVRAAFACCIFEVFFPLCLLVFVFCFFCFLQCSPQPQRSSVWELFSFFFFVIGCCKWWHSLLNGLHFVPWLHSAFPLRSLHILVCSMFIFLQYLFTDCCVFHLLRCYICTPRSFSTGNEFYNNK